MQPGKFPTYIRVAILGALLFLAGCSSKEKGKDGVTTIDQFENAKDIFGLKFDVDPGDTFSFETKVPLRVKDRKYLLDLVFNKEKGKVNGSFNILSSDDETGPEEKGIQ